MIRERYDIAIGRIREMAGEEKKNFKEYFDKGVNLLLQVDEIYNLDIRKASEAELEKLNKDMYKELEKDNYKTSFANPDFAKEKLGEYSKLLCYLYTKIRDLIPYAYTKEIEIITI